MLRLFLPVFEFIAQVCGYDGIGDGDELVSAVPATAVALEIVGRSALNHSVGEIGLGVDGALVVVYLTFEQVGYLGAVHKFLGGEVRAELACGLFVRTDIHKPLAVEVVGEEFVVLPGELRECGGGVGGGIASECALSTVLAEQVRTEFFL